jgi:hypothetical protein
MQLRGGGHRKNRPVQGKHGGSQTRARAHVFFPRVSVLKTNILVADVERRIEWCVLNKTGGRAAQRESDPTHSTPLD